MKTTLPTFNGLEANSQKRKGCRMWNDLIYLNSAYGGQQKLSAKHGNWPIFTLEGTLTAIKYPFSNLMFIRPLLWVASPDNFFDASQADPTSSFVGLGSFSDLGDNQIPKSLLHGRKEFVNSMMDVVSTAARNSKKHFADDVNKNASIFDSIPIWAAATILQTGYILDDEKVLDLNMSFSQVKQLLPQLSFEELALFAAAKRVDEVEDWLPYLHDLKNNPDFIFSLKNLQKFLIQGVAAEEAYTYMKVPEVWLDELLQA